MRKRFFLSVLTLVLSPSFVAAQGASTIEVSSIKAISPDELTKAKFALFLSSLIQRWGYEKPNKTLPPEVMLPVSDAFLRTSVRQKVENSGEKYDLLYHVFSDTFFLLKFKGGTLDSIGASSGSVLSEKLVSDKGSKNYFETTLVKRPALFRVVAEQFPNIPKAEKMFSWFTLDEHESLLLQENIKSFLKLLEWGSDEPCRKAAQAYMRANLPIEGQSKASANIHFYPSIGLKTNEGRYLAFADEETNRYFGFLIFDLNDTKVCKPKTVMKSAF